MRAIDFSDYLGLTQGILEGYGFVKGSRKSQPSGSITQVEARLLDETSVVRELRKSRVSLDDGYFRRFGGRGLALDLRRPPPLPRLFCFELHIRLVSTALYYEVVCVLRAKC